jgi:hypothetical protein
VAVDALRHLPKQRFGGVARGLFGFAGSAKGGLGGLEVAQFGLEVVAGVGQRVRSAATSPKVAKFAFSTEMKLFIHARKSASFGGMYSRAIVSPRGFLSSPAPTLLQDRRSYRRIVIPIDRIGVPIDSVAVPIDRIINRIDGIADFIGSNADPIDRIGVAENSVMLEA